jgi:hypothetical protein
MSTPSPPADATAGAGKTCLRAMLAALAGIKGTIRTPLTVYVAHSHLWPTPPYKPLGTSVNRCRVALKGQDNRAPGNAWGRAPG